MPALNRGKDTPLRPGWSQSTVSRSRSTRHDGVAVARRASYHKGHRVGVDLLGGYVVLQQHIPTEHLIDPSVSKRAGPICQTVFADREREASPAFAPLLPCLKDSTQRNTCPGTSSEIEWFRKTPPKDICHR